MWRVTFCFLLALKLEAQQWKVVGYLPTPSSALPPSAIQLPRGMERHPELRLQGPYPNPISVNQVLEGTNPAVTFTLPRQGHTRIGVYNIIGQLIAPILDDGRDAGVDYSVLLELPEDLPTGLYLVRFEFGGKIITRKMILLR